MKHRMLFAGACSLLLLALACCERATPPAEPTTAGGSMGSYSWSAPVSNADPLPGIDQAYLWAWWVDNKPQLLIWVDVEKPNGKSVATADGGFDGRLNDIPIKFDGKRMIVTIDGTDYDLASGSLLLISTQREKPVVKQLNRNVSELAVMDADGAGLDNTKLKALARADVDIAAFFGLTLVKPLTPY